MSQAHRYEQILSAAVLNRLEANIRIQVPGQTWGVRDHVSPWQNPRLDLGDGRRPNVLRLHATIRLLAVLGHSGCSYSP